MVAGQDTGVTFSQLVMCATHNQEKRKEKKKKS